MRTIPEISAAVRSGQPITKGEDAKLSRYLDRAAKHREHLLNKARQAELAAAREARKARQTEAEHRQQQAADAIARIHRAA